MLYFVIQRSEVDPNIGKEDVKNMFSFSSLIAKSRILCEMYFYFLPVALIKLFLTFYCYFYVGRLRLNFTLFRGSDFFFKSIPF